MSETANIAEMAIRVSSEIFSVFGWEKHPAHDENWKCVEEGHGKKTHPSDVVFSYDEPYSNLRTFFTVDLKSYAASTVDRAKVSGALKSIAMCTECANKSAKWKRIYTGNNQYARASGLLFVYNHDGEYDDDFQHILNLCAQDGIDLPAGQRFIVLGPDDVAYLATVAADIERLRGRRSQERLPEPEHCTFWYPDLVSVKHRGSSHLPATIEMLTSPWIVMKCEETVGKTQRTRFVVWYKEHLGTVDEFKYLLDYFFRYQMLGDETTVIDVRIVRPKAETISDFHSAKQSYSNDLLALPLQRLDRVRCFTVTNIVRAYNGLDVGWRNV